MDQLARTRRLLIAAVAWRALALGFAVALAIASVVVIVSALSGRGSPPWLLAAALTAGAVAGALIWQRAGGVPSMSSAAMYAEQRVPALSYSLVTLIEAQRTTWAAALERAAARTTWAPLVHRHIARQLVRPTAVLSLAVGALAVASSLPAHTLRSTNGIARDGGRSGTSERGSLESPWTGLAATVVAPLYTDVATTRIENPVTIAGIAGSRIALGADAPAGSISARLDGAEVRGAATAREWRLELTMPARPAALVLRSGTRSRVILLNGRPDSVPVVTLELPRADTVLRSVQGAIALRAHATDDVAVDAVWWEYIISSGTGESFTFRSGRLATIRRSTSRRATTMDGRVVLDSLGLGPGDVVHVRAAARDGNTVTGPGMAVSETRALRIARAGEYDSISVDAAPPPPADTSLISQRMLIRLTEALDRRRPAIARAQMVSESRRIARDQARLRRQVGDVVFMRAGGEASAEHEHTAEDGHGHSTDDPLLRAARTSEDSLLAMAQRANRATESTSGSEAAEAPVIAINRPLLEAYNAMWDAGRELELGETARALPPMRRALAAIQRARAAERIYLRGRPPAVVIDIARVRLQGKERGGGSARSAVAPLPGTAARAVGRFDRAVDLLTRQSGMGIDSLLLMRVELALEEPAAAASLDAAIAQLRSGADATEMLRRARLALTGRPAHAQSLGGWTGAW